MGDGGEAVRRQRAVTSSALRLGVGLCFGLGIRLGRLAGRCRRLLKLIEPRLHAGKGIPKRREVAVRRCKLILEGSDVAIGGVELLLGIERVFGDHLLEEFHIALQAAGAPVEPALARADLDAGQILRADRQSSQQQSDRRRKTDGRNDRRRMEAKMHVHNGGPPEGLRH